MLKLLFQIFPIQIVFFSVHCVTPPFLFLTNGAQALVRLLPNPFQSQNSYFHNTDLLLAYPAHYSVYIFFLRFQLLLSPLYKLAPYLCFPIGRKIHRHKNLR
jgi:hypothetical protein